MEQKLKDGRRLEHKIIWVLKALVCSYVVTGTLLLLLTFLLYKWNLDEGKVTAGIIVIYVASTLIGGVIIGKLAATRKFVWGLTIGILYFALLLIISLAIYRTLQGNGNHILTTFILCALGGMLGGMVS